MTQANLACSLGVPQQSIQIRNVTLKYMNGTRVSLPFDPAIAQLNSGTDVVCMTTATGPLRGRLLNVHRRTQQQDYTIEISYDIVDPPLIILAMDSATFTATITNNTIMIDLVSALGGTGVDAEAPPELTSGLAATTASPDSTTSNTISQAQMMMYGGIGAAIAVLAIVVAMTAFFIGRSQRRINPTTTGPTRIVYVVDNPLSKSPDVSVDYKNNYTPTSIRR